MNEAKPITKLEMAWLMTQVIVVLGLLGFMLWSIYGTLFEVIIDSAVGSRRGG